MVINGNTVGHRVPCGEIDGYAEITTAAYCTPQFAGFCQYPRGYRTTVYFFISGSIILMMAGNTMFVSAKYHYLLSGWPAVLPLPAQYLLPQPDISVNYRPLCSKIDLPGITIKFHFQHTALSFHYYC